MTKIGNNFEGTRGIVAGATGTVGREIGMELENRGCELLVIGRSEERLALWSHRGIQVCRWDCENPELSAESLERGVATFLGEDRKIDFAVNCTGIGGWWTVGDMQLEQWTTLLNVNLTSAIVFTKAVLPYMIEGGGGLIVHVSSVAACNPKPLSSGYAACKAGLEAFAQSANQEVACHGVRVLCQTPTEHILGRFVKEAWDRSSIVARQAKSEMSWELNNSALSNFVKSLVSILDSSQQ